MPFHLKAANKSHLIHLSGESLLAFLPLRIPFHLKAANKSNPFHLSGESLLTLLPLRMPVHTKAGVKADVIRDKQVVRSKHDRTNPPGASALETLIMQKSQKILLILLAKIAKRLCKDQN